MRSEHNEVDSTLKQDSLVITVARHAKVNEFTST